MEIYAATEAILEEVARLLEQEGIEVVLTQDSTTYIEELIQTLG
ncbi:hypothetical protein [Thiocapsa sp.]|nr:hypothetical protein [Thiocapsa sp.]HSO82432.1 hypothetical protein [Thiocapsa sp.]